MTSHEICTIQGSTARHSKARFAVLRSECLQLSRFLSQAKEGASLAAAWSKQRESQRGKEREIAEEKE